VFGGEDTLYYLFTVGHTPEKYIGIYFGFHSFASQRGCDECRLLWACSCPLWYAMWNMRR
jgi:hypothetical protein